MSGKLKQAIKKTIQFFKHNSYIKYFIFIAYAIFGSVFFYAMYRVNEPNVFNFKQYKTNQEFHIENNSTSSLRYIYYDKENNKIYASFQNQISSGEQTTNKNIFPIIYRAKVVRGKLLDTKIYSSIEDLYILEINDVPPKFKSMKISVVLDNFEKTQKENRDRADFFYINNNEEFKNTFSDFNVKSQSSTIENIVTQSLKNMIASNNEKIKELELKIKDYNSKIADYQSTKNLSDNKDDELALDKINSNIKNIESYIDQEELKIDELNEKSETYKVEITKSSSNNLSIKEFKFNYDIEKEKNEE